MLDFVKPQKELGIHSFDIVTIKCPDGSIQVLSCLLWAECEGLTSHGTTAGFTIDIKNEKIAEKLCQYGVHFNRPGNEEYIGRKVPGVQKACEQAIAAHKSVNKDYGWVGAIGWDCMFTDKDDQIVFFEGNLGMARTPRMMFLNHHNTKDFITDFFWPFDQSRSIQPV